MLAQKNYHLWQHDRVAVVVHWVICKRHESQKGAKWYEHTPGRALKNDIAKILWDFSIQTDTINWHHTSYKPDIINVVIIQIIIGALGIIGKGF